MNADFFRALSCRACLILALVSLLSQTSYADIYRIWDRANGDYLPWGRKLIAVEGEHVTLEKERDQSRERVALADLAEHERRLIRLWQDDKNRPALERAMELGNIDVNTDGGVEISIRNWRVTDADLKLFAGSLPELASLSLDHCSISLDGLRVLTQAKRLKSLTIPLIQDKADRVNRIEVNINGQRQSDGDRSLDPGFQIVAQIPSLESFEFHGNGSHSVGEHFTAFAKTRIKKLVLRNARLSSEDLKRIAAIPQLEHLSPGLNRLSTDIQPPVLQHLKGMRHLRVLDLWGTELTDEDAPHLADFSALRELHVGGWTPAGFRQIGKMQELQTLRILDAFEGTCLDDDVYEIAKLKNLKVLWLSSPKLTDAGIAHLADMIQLEALHLPDSITPKVLPHLEKLTKLKELSLPAKENGKAGESMLMSQALHELVDKRGKTVQEALHALDRRIPTTGKLRSVGGYGIPKLDKESGKYLKRLDNLELLSFDEGPLDEWIAQFSPFKSVHTITIDGQTTSERVKESPERLPISAAGIRHLAGWDNLTELRIWRCDIGPQALKTLADCPQLKRLTLNGSQLAGGDFSALRGLTRLQELELGLTNFAADDLQHVAALSELRELTLSGRLSLDELRQLKGLNKLERLTITREHLPFAELWQMLLTDFGRTPQQAAALILDTTTGAEDRITKLKWHFIQTKGTTNAAEAEAQMAILKHLPDLTELELPEGVADDSLKHLVHTPHLKRLDIKSANVTDAGLKHLSGLKELDFFHAWEAPLTEKGVLELVRLPKIKHIVLWTSKVDEATAKRIEQEHKGVSIVAH